MFLERIEPVVLRAVHAEAPTATQRAVRAFLALSALVYGGLVRARNAGYDTGLFRTWRLPCQVVSIGNLTAGGTGKTPTVIALTTAAIANGLRPCVLLRGYGREGGGVRVVSDGAAVGVDWREAGDEAILLAERLPGAPVVVGGDRVHAGRVAVERFRPDVIFLDDGFQHRRIGRNADLVLVDATDPFGRGRLLPRGRLREPITGLRRAHGILVTRTDQVGDLDVVARRLAQLAPGCPMGMGVFRPTRLRELASGRAWPVAELRGKRVVAVSGVANPGSFQGTGTSAGGIVVGRQEYRDHHVFTVDDCRRMVEAVRREKAEWIVTTEKDAVRLRSRLPVACPVIALGVDLDITNGADALAAVLGVPVRASRRG